MKIYLLLSHDKERPVFFHERAKALGEAKRAALNLAEVRGAWIRLSAVNTPATLDLASLATFLNDPAHLAGHEVIFDVRYPADDLDRTDKKDNDGEGQPQLPAASTLPKVVPMGGQPIEKEMEALLGRRTANAG